MRITQTPPAALIATHAALATGVHGVISPKVLNEIVDALEIVNAGAGANPVLSANAASQLLALAGHFGVTGNLEADDYVSFKSTTGYWVTLAHACSAHRLVTFPDKPITVAGIVDLQEHLMIGAANAKWLPLVFASDLNAIMGVNRGFYSTGQYWGNQSADNSSISFMLGIPLTLGALNLYVKAVRYELIGADATNKVTAIYAYKNQTEIDTDATDRTAAAVYTLTFSAAESLVGFEIFVLLIDCVLADIDTLKISHAEAEVYYA